MVGCRFQLVSGLLALVVGLSGTVEAQAQAAPQPGYPPPPAAPAPGSPPPPGTYSPPAYPAYPAASGAHPVAYPTSAAAWGPLAYPAEFAYREGMPLPEGYRLEERPRRGFVLGGWLATGIPYAIGVMLAASADFENESGWMVVPFLGPWMTLGRRDYGCDDRSDAKCVENAVIAPLVMSGIAQAAGGTLLIVGYTVTKRYAVRKDLGFTVLPSRVGSGYGLTWVGGF